VRDVAAYLIASAVTLALLWDGAFARYEAIVQILLYILYLSICIYTSRCAISNPVVNATLWVCASQPS
jgi:Ca2+/Na+ antiporter